LPASCSEAGLTNDYLIVGQTYKFPHISKSAYIAAVKRNNTPREEFIKWNQRNSYFPRLIKKDFVIAENTM
jgi:hypothetical protein